MVHKSGDWLFPECFDFILEEQLPSGAWESYATPLDGILNTAAARLALKKHLRKLDPERRHDHHHGDWPFRTHRAEAALKDMLHDWDVESTDQVARGNAQPTIANVKPVLRRFVKPFELQTFLLAHISHAEDNHKLRAQWGQALAASHNGNGKGNPNGNVNGHINGNSNGHSNGNTNGHSNGSNGQANGTTTTTTAPAYNNPGRTFYHWVRSTSADHTSTTPSPIPTLSTASTRASYLTEAAARHLAGLCRMYNDAGSSGRDAYERALNSLNFPEFAPNPTARHHHLPGRNHKRGVRYPKEELLWLADFERRGLETAVGMLEDEVGDVRLVGALRLFVRVTALYEQIYVLRDVGTRTGGR
ncbi:hypothetical protein B0I37DRAFT_418444 [Chaetomium sp. MPI-CAGE-AT-0009]|nr:hypothetical protein B0I37DRAFT_418444 [Chaetomium sp. MPI-CAGE-AT-0009]